MRAIYFWVAPLVAVFEFPRKYIAEGIKSEHVPKGILKKAKGLKIIDGDEAPKGILEKAKASKARELTFADTKVVRMYETKESEDFFKNHKHSEESEQALNNQEEEAYLDLETLDAEYPEKGEEYEERMAEIDARLAAIRELKRKIKEWEQETPDFENEVLGTVEIGYGEKVPKQMPSESEDDLEAETLAPQSEGGAKETEGEEAPSKAKGIVLMRQAKAVKDQFDAGELDYETAGRKIGDLYQRFVKMFGGTSPRKKVIKVWNSEVMSDTRAAKDILKQAKGLARKAVSGEIPFEVVREFLGDLEKEWETRCKLDKIVEEDERVDEFQEAVAILKDERNFGPVKEVEKVLDDLEALMTEVAAGEKTPEEARHSMEKLEGAWQTVRENYEVDPEDVEWFESGISSLKDQAKHIKEVDQILDSLEALLDEATSGRKTMEEARPSVEQLEATWQKVRKNHKVEARQAKLIDKSFSILRDEEQYALKGTPPPSSPAERVLEPSTAGRALRGDQEHRA